MRKKYERYTDGLGRWERDTRHAALAEIRKNMERGYGQDYLGTTPYNNYQSFRVMFKGPKYIEVDVPDNKMKFIRTIVAYVGKSVRVALRKLNES